MMEIVQLERLWQIRYQIQESFTLVEKEQEGSDGMSGLIPSNLYQSKLQEIMAGKSLPDSDQVVDIKDENIGHHRYVGSTQV